MKSTTTIELSNKDLNNMIEAALGYPGKDDIKVEYSCSVGKDNEWIVAAKVTVIDEKEAPCAAAG